MAKYNAGYLSPIKNKLGNAVGRKWRNLDVLAVYQPNVHNPRTTAQMANRNKLSLASHAGSMLRAAIRLGLTGVTKNTRVFPRAKFVSLNVAEMPSTGLTIPYDHIVVAKGSTPMPVFGTIDLSTPQTARIEWDNTALDSIIPPSKLSNLKVYLVVLCTNLGVSIVSQATDFAEGNISASLPNGWNGLAVETWGFARYEGANDEELGLINSMASDSTYLGKGTVN